MKGVIAMNTTNTASQYFNDHWQKYQATVQSNTLYHREMMSTLDSFINNNIGNKPFSMVDAGCGDCSMLAPVIRDKMLNRYIGIDGAQDVLQLAAQALVDLNCEKQFICDNMQNAIATIPANNDIIFTSYAVHHLSHEQKSEFIQHCHHKLNSGGYFIMVDGVLKENQTRDEWLDELENRVQLTQSLSPEELKMRMQHPRQDDFPEAISTFREIAKTQHWQQFEVLFQKEIYAFMIFKK